MNLTLDLSKKEDTLLGMTTTLTEHNTRELPLIDEMRRNEQHLAKEFIKDLDLEADWVVAAIEERLADIILQGEGQHMAQLVD